MESLAELAGLAVGGLAVVIILCIIWGIPFYLFKIANKISLKKIYELYPLSLQEYLKKYPHAQTLHGIACHICNSKRIHKKGSLKLAVYTCNSCNAQLYHTKND